MDKQQRVHDLSVKSKNLAAESNRLLDEQDRLIGKLKDPEKESEFLSMGRECRRMFYEQVEIINEMLGLLYPEKGEDAEG